MLFIQTLSPYPINMITGINIRLSYRAENKKPLGKPANTDELKTAPTVIYQQHEPKEVQLVRLNGYLVACDETFGQVDFFHGSW